MKGGRCFLCDTPIRSSNLGRHIDAHRCACGHRYADHAIGSVCLAAEDRPGGFCYCNRWEKP